MNIIKCHLEKVPANDFQKDILLAPIWVRKNANTMNYQDIERIAELEECIRELSQRICQ